MITRFAIGFLPLLVALLAPALACADGTDQQRRDFLAAMDAAKARDTKQLARLVERNRDYILNSYLRYEFLKDRLALTPPAVLHQFVTDNADAAVSGILRDKWLHFLAARGDWKTFMQEYPAAGVDDVELQCDRLTYLLRQTPEDPALLAEAGRLWLSPVRQPGACDPAFARWRQAGQMTNDIVWQRIRLAMQRQNLTLAAQLGTSLPAEDQVWVHRWLAMHRAPLRELEKLSYPVETPTARAIVIHGVLRLAQTDPGVAMDHWDALKAKYAFTSDDNDQVLRSLGILAAQNHLPQALTWLDEVSPKLDDEALRQWRLRAAIATQRWDAAARYYPALSDTERHDSQWRYWEARILEKVGQQRHAKRIYKELAKERGYYGFLAADRLGADYSMQHVSIEVTPQELTAMGARRGIQMAQELFVLGQAADARRQWAWATRTMNNRELQIAAVLAARWGWHDRAILTLTRTDQLDDLELRFPVLYREYVEANAQQNNIDPGWVYGVMRQESAFVTDARSAAGALGLMQLMPSTGRMAGRLLNVRLRNPQALLEVQNNLKLGTYYLKTVLDEYHGHQVLATAAYNAGPNRVRDWLPGQTIDADVWVENIPYNETRNYVKNVMAFTTVYDYRLGNVPMRLERRMSSVAPIDN